MRLYRFAVIITLFLLLLIATGHMTTALIQVGPLQTNVSATGLTLMCWNSMFLGIEFQSPHYSGYLSLPHAGVGHVNRWDLIGINLPWWLIMLVWLPLLGLAYRRKQRLQRPPARFEIVAPISDGAR